MHEQSTRDRLLMSLEAAVPLYVRELTGLHPHMRAVRARRYAREAMAAPLVSSQARGVKARALSQLARGLAALSIQPGGIAVFGRTFCGWHHPAGKVQSTDRQFCAQCVAHPSADRIEGMEPRIRAAEALTRLGDSL